jgi:hypothetical protein
LKSHPCIAADEFRFRMQVQYLHVNTLERVDSLILESNKSNADDSKTFLEQSTSHADGV